ncbi:MAG: MFS transporter [archaeon]
MEKNRKLLQTILFIMTLGSSLYGLFLPIYYLNQGIPFQRIVFFMIAYCLGGFLSGIFSNLIIHRFGVKSFIVSRGLLEPMLIAVINYNKYIGLPVELQGLFLGMIVFAFWTSMDALTVKTTQNGSRGKQQGNLYSGMWIASIIAPFIGGFIISRFNYTVLFIIALLFVLFGGILSLFIRLDVTITKKINWFPKYNGRIGTHMFLVFLRGATFGVVAFLFPLFIYEIFKNELTVGTFGFVFGVAALLATVVSGHLIDRYKVKAMIAIFGLNAILWLLLGMRFTSYLLYSLLVLVFFDYSLLNVCMNTLFFDDVEKLDAVTLVTERMMSFSLGGALLFVLALFLNYHALFIICGILCLGSVFVARRLDAAIINQ